jgi:hypothetical protein
MFPAEFELAFPAGERPQNHILDRAATGTGRIFKIELKGKESVIASKKGIGRTHKII